MKIKTAKNLRLYHVSGDPHGILAHGYDFEMAGSSGGTLYGKALHVSTEPDAWRRIARLGNAPALRVHLPKGASIADIYASFGTGDTASMPEFIDWIRHTHPEKLRRMFRLTRYDDELGDETCMDFASEKEAREESEDDEPQIETVETVDHENETRLLFDFVRSLDPAVIGLWYDQDLDPGNYSAPHAVIFDTRGIRFSLAETAKKIVDAMLGRPAA